MIRDGHGSMLSRRLCGRIIVLAGILALCAPLKAWSQAEAEQEALVKAAFLYNFAKFVQWPQDASPDPDGKVLLCILGEDTLGKATETIEDKPIGERSLAVRRCERLDEVRGCDILFVCSSELGELAGILGSVRGLNILTVSDARDFARHGGIIGLVAEENKIRFEINLEAAKLAHLEISSKLLKLARIVGDTAGRKREP